MLRCLKRSEAVGAGHREESQGAGDLVLANSDIQAVPELGVNALHYSSAGPRPSLPTTRNLTGTANSKSSKT